MGPPGAGKGTQAELIAQRFQIPAISTGDIFRANIKNGTPLGTQVSSILAAGGYVPDELTNEIVKDRLGQPDARGGFLLDGYPRTVGQVEYLGELLESWGTGIDLVVQLVVDEDAVVERLVKRAAEQGRADDTEDVIRERQAIYRAETAPLIEAYGAQGILTTVDGMGSMAEVTARLMTALDAVGH